MARAEPVLRGSGQDGRRERPRHGQDSEDGAQADIWSMSHASYKQLLNCLRAAKLSHEAEVTPLRQTVLWSLFDPLHVRVLGIRFGYS